MAGKTRHLEHIRVPSDIGVWRISTSSEAIMALELVNQVPSHDPDSQLPIALEAKSQLSAYFDGQLNEFDLPLDLSGHPPFYQQVWQELLKVPYGRTNSYSDLANRLSNPKAVRAVGMANGKNPIALIIPCHRILGKDRSLTGYAYGLNIKKWLLELEGAIARPLELF